MNEVVLEGRLSAAPERRTLPSGDEVVTFRVVVPRGDGRVDALPVSVGPGPGSGRRPVRGQPGRRLLAAAAGLPADGRIRIEGALRRRWWRSGEGPRSRIEVAATTVERLDPD